MKKGFTLTELLFVVAIVSILAGLGISKMSEITKNALITQAKSDVRNLINKESLYYAENYDYSSEFEDLELKNENKFSINLQTCDSRDGYKIFVSNISLEDTKVVYDSCNEKKGIYLSNLVSMSYYEAFNQNNADSAEEIFLTGSNNKIQAGSYDSLSKILGAESLEVSGDYQTEMLTNLEEVDSLYINNVNGMSVDLSFLNDIKINDEFKLRVKSVSEKASADSDICQNFSSLSVTDARDRALSYDTICN